MSEGHERKAFMRGPGALHYNDVGIRMFEHVVAEIQSAPFYDFVDEVEFDPDMYENESLRRDNQYASAYPLWLVTKAGTTRYRDYLRFHDSSRAAQKIDIPKQSLKDMHEHAAFHFGLAELDFAWHFPSFVVKIAADDLAQTGVISQEQRDGLTLPDYAHILSTSWFADAIKELSGVGNSVFRNLGREPQHYKSNPARHAEPIPIYFEFFSEQEGANSMYSGQLNQWTRERIRRSKIANQKDSVGCPVGWEDVLVEDTPDNQSAIKNLLDRRRIADPMPRQRPGDDRLRVQFEEGYSAIDDGLLSLVEFYKTYMHWYGVPVLNLQEKRIEHTETQESQLVGLV